MRTLSLIVPVFGAPDLVRVLLGHIDELQRVAKAHGFELTETIIVDDGTEPKISVSNVPGVRVIRNERNRGKGYSVKRGALSSSGEWVLMSDVDMSTPFTEFAQLAEACNDCDGDAWMICGSRYGRPGMPWKRRVLSGLFRIVVSVIGGISGVRDTQCGFKLFRMDAMRAIFEAQQIDRFAFDVELIRRVLRAGGVVKEVPVVWHGGKRSSLCVFRDAPRMLWDLIKHI